MLITGHWKTRWMFWLGLALLLSQVSVHAAPEITERVEWKKIPIRLELTVGQERRVEFLASVKVGVPGNLQSLLRTQSVNGTVYLGPRSLRFDPSHDSGDRWRSNLSFRCGGIERARPEPSDADLCTGRGRVQQSRLLV